MTRAITQTDGISCDLVTVLDDEDTVGRCENIVPGDETIVYEDASRLFWIVRTFFDYEPDGDDGHLFISSDGGEVAVHASPEFAPIETCIKVWQYKRARRALDAVEYDLLFDDAGLVAFRGAGTGTVVAPIQWPWDKPSPRRAPRAPGGPTP